MGQDHVVHCRCCGWRAGPLHYGSADALQCPEIALNAVEEPNRSEVLEISRAGNAVFRECAFRLFKCPECRVLSSHLIVRLALSDGTLFQPVLSCHACNRQLVEVSLEEIDSAACPICDRPALADELLLCWD